MVLSEHEFSSLGYSSQLIRRGHRPVAAIRHRKSEPDGRDRFVGLIVPHMAR